MLLFLGLPRCDGRLAGYLLHPGCEAQGLLLALAGGAEALGLHLLYLHEVVAEVADALRLCAVDVGEDALGCGAVPADDLPAVPAVVPAPHHCEVLAADHAAGGVLVGHPDRRRPRVVDALLVLTGELLVLS